MSYDDPYQQQPPQYPYQQPGYQQPGYQQPGYYPPPGTGGQTNVMAILSLVFAFVFWPVGIVLGHIAKRQIQERNEQGEGLATAGLVLSYVFAALNLIACAAWIAIVAFAVNDSG